ncbi:dTMP kinase [Tessaracoccus sp.]
MTAAFVVFEGGDGVGKSTQVAMLAAFLAQRGHSHTVTRQPGGTSLGTKLRGLILDHGHGDVAPRAEALMYAADKAQHMHEVVGPALARGDVVICDRYVDSMIAYQGAGRALALDEVALVAGWATHDLRPDLTVLLDADPADAVEQISLKDRVEGAGIEFHRRARTHLLHLAHQNPDAYLVLDARRAREDLSVTIAARVATLIER